MLGEVPVVVSAHCEHAHFAETLCVCGFPLLRFLYRLHLKNKLICLATLSSNSDG